MATDGKALKNLDQEAEHIAKDDPQATRFVVQCAFNTLFLY